MHYLPSLTPPQRGPSPTPHHRKHTSTGNILAPLLLLLLTASPTLVLTLAGASDNIATNEPLTPALPSDTSNLKVWPDGARPNEEALRELKRRYGEHDLHGREVPHHDRPLYVRKLPADEQAKFYHYSDLEVLFSPNPEIVFPVSSSSASADQQQQQQQQQTQKPTSYQSPHHLVPPLLHARNPPSGSSLFARQFTCPSNSYPCTNINAPTYCCRTDQRCETVPDTGLGTIGCCPLNQLCTGPLTGCSTDQVTCSQSQGGGCCIKGYKCSTNGCIPDTAQTVTATPTVTGAQTTLACNDGFYACPSELAGGCCRSGRACGVELCPATETGGGGGGPVVTGDLCPTGFYSCAARFNGGCCRVGRDCGLTHCPARGTGLPTTEGHDEKTSVTATTTATAGGGGGGGGTCQRGWHSCPPSFDGGCCPLGYDCGVTNCPANTLNGAVPDETKAPFQPNVGSAAAGRGAGGAGYLVGTCVAAVVGVVVALAVGL